MTLPSHKYADPALHVKYPGEGGAVVTDEAKQVRRVPSASEVGNRARRIQILVKQVMRGWCYGAK